MYRNRSIVKNMDLFNPRCGDPLKYVKDIKGNACHFPLKSLENLWNRFSTEQIDCLTLDQQKKTLQTANSKWWAEVMIFDVSSTFMELKKNNNGLVSTFKHA